MCRVPGLEGGRGWVGLWGGRPAVCPLHPAALCSEWGLAVHSESFAPQVVHMGWVSERLGGASSSQTFRPRFLALKGSSLYVFVSPPVSGPLGLGQTLRRPSLKKLGKNALGKEGLDEAQRTCAFHFQLPHTHFLQVPQLRGTHFSRILCRRAPPRQAHGDLTSLAP